jgi:hypothetical protein
MVYEARVEGTFSVDFAHILGEPSDYQRKRLVEQSDELIIVQDDKFSQGWSLLITFIDGKEIVDTQV